MAKSVNMREATKKAFRDSLTNSVGDYDPARLFGYGFTLLAGLVFLGLAIYDTVVKHSFDYGGFATGAGAMALVITGTAAGVALKSGTEAKPAELTKSNTDTVAE